MIRFKCALRIECERCCNATTATGHSVARLIRSQEVQALRKRLQCPLCGAKEARIKLLNPDPPRRAIPGQFFLCYLQATQSIGMKVG